MTVSPNVVVRARPPPVPVTVIVVEPMGVEVERLIVRIEEKVGEAVQVGTPAQPLTKEGLAPVGSPLTERVTG